MMIVPGHQYGLCHNELSGYDNVPYDFGPVEWSVYENGLGYLSTYEMLGCYKNGTPTRENASSNSGSWEACL
jgi:hypothetical protein